MATIRELAKEVFVREARVAERQPSQVFRDKGATLDLKAKITVLPIGDTSSGKSTLFNTILGVDVLPEASLRTTGFALRVLCRSPNSRLEDAQPTQNAADTYMGMDVECIIISAFHAKRRGAKEGSPDQFDVIFILHTRGTRRETMAEIDNIKEQCSHGYNPFCSASRLLAISEGMEWCVGFSDDCGFRIIEEEMQGRISDHYEVHEGAPADVFCVIQSQAFQYMSGVWGNQFRDDRLPWLL